MATHDKEEPEFLRQSLHSMAVQSVKADEVVIVKDGPLTEALESVLDFYSEQLNIVALELKENVGLGAALRVGVPVCRGKYVARMDSDDICCHKRFEKQLAFLEANPNVAAVGSAVAEFQHDPDVIEAIKRLPCGAKQLRRYAKFRNPLVHPTVIFRKSAVLEVGNYQPMHLVEDYGLFVRMLAHGQELRNLEEILVLVRQGNGVVRRRGGISYAVREAKLYRSFLKLGFISPAEFAFNVVIRAPVRVVPPPVRSFVYRRFLRHRGGK
jgi:glycosyltransferase involved in cell wall biosynthesis